MSKTTEIIKGERIGVCFLGNLPAKAKWDLTQRRNLQAAMRKFILWAVEGTPVTIHAGLDLGPETVWASEATEARRALGGRVRYEAHVYGGVQVGRWKTDDIRRWRTLQTASDACHDYKGDGAAGARLDRDRAMIDASETVLVLWDGVEAGHTWENIVYARAKQRVVVILDPETLDTRMDAVQIKTSKRRKVRQEAPEGLAPDGRPLGFDGTEFRFVCPVCSSIVVKTAAFGRRHRRLKRRGPFCSRKCAGIGSSPAHRES